MSAVTPNKESVQKKIASILTPLKDENERKLRGFQIAKMCFAEKMFDEANKYIKEFLSVHTSAAAFKLQGEILEQIHDGNKALESYKRAFEIDEADNVGVLSKICELGAANRMDENVLQFYREKAEEKEKQNSLFRFKNRSFATPTTPSTHLFSTSTPTRGNVPSRSNPQPSPQNISAVAPSQSVNATPTPAPALPTIKDNSNVLEHLVNVLIDQNKTLMDSIKETVDYAVKEMRDSHLQINQAVDKLRENYANVNKNVDELSDMINSLRDLKVTQTQVKSDENTPKPSPPRPPAPTPVVLEQQNIQPASTLPQMNPLAQYALQMQLQSAIQQQATKQNLMYSQFQNPTALPEYRNLMYYQNQSMCGGSTIPTQAPPASNYQFGPGIENQAESAANSLAALSQMARNQQPLSNPQPQPLAPREPVPLNFAKNTPSEGFKPNFGETFKPNPQTTFKPNKPEVNSPNQPRICINITEELNKTTNNSTGDCGRNQDVSLVKSEKDEAEDFEPTISFKPICELPSNIIVKTGEEEELTLFCNRGKLYRYDSKANEWKERGLGDIKILKHKSNGKSRIICRREQVYKLACNHYITPDMKLTKLKTAENCWSWIAQDFADEELKTETFAARFKFSSKADEFKSVFENCVNAEKSGPPTDSKNATSPQKPKEVEKPNESKSGECTAKTAFEDLMKGRENEWECNVCLIRNQNDKTECISCTNPKPGHEKEKSESKSNSGGSFTPGFLGGQGALNLSVNTGQKGFSVNLPNTKPMSSASSTSSPAPKSLFSFSTTTTQPSSTDTANSNSNLSQPFAFNVVTSSATKSTAASISSTTGFKFTFGSNESDLQSGKSGILSTSSNSKPLFGTPQKLQGEISTVGSPAVNENQSYLNTSSENPEDHESSAYFEPIVKLDAVDVVTGEENENVLFKSRAKLFRFVTDEWKERGIGDLKILQRKDNFKCRILMRRDQIHKICLNHTLKPELTLSEMTNSHGKAWVWQADDFADEEIKHEQFAIRFKTAEIANSFKEAFNKAKNCSEKLVDCQVIVSPQRKESVGANAKVASPKQATPKESEKKESIFTFSTPTTSSNSFAFAAPPTSASQIKFNFGEAPKLPFTKQPGETVKPATQSNSNNSSMLHKLLCDKEDTLKSSDKEKPTFSFSLPSSIPESEVIFIEAKLPSKEKIDIANKFKLPKSFYNYENKKSCKGCVGCNPDDFDFSTIGKKPENSIKPNDVKVEPNENRMSTPQKNLFGNVSGNASFASFSAIASGGSASGWTAKTEGFKFSGTGSQLFKSSKPQEGEDDEDVPCNNDIHFEPIVKLDEIDVKTGEEDEEIIFNERAKLYRFVDDQWKERGVGQMKILKNKAGKFRILLRREQVLKLACNHRITPHMTMDSLRTSETALCWSANDYSESEDGVFEKFTVRFKNKELKDNFKEVFDSCKRAIQNEEKKHNSSNASQASYDDGEYETEDELEVAFQKRVTLSYLGKDGKSVVNSFQGDLTVQLDEDLSVYRIQLIDDSTGQLVCNHVICQEYAIYRYDKTKSFYVQWEAQDFSTDDPENKAFRVKFSSESALKEFVKIFTEGTELAKEGNISKAAQPVEMERPCVYSS